MKLLLRLKLTLVTATIIAGSGYARSDNSMQPVTMDQLNGEFYESCVRTSLFREIAGYLNPERVKISAWGANCHPAFWDAKVNATIIDPSYGASEIQDSQFRELLTKIHQDAIWRSDGQLLSVSTPGKTVTLRPGQSASQDSGNAPPLERVPGYTNSGQSIDDLSAREK